MMNQFYFRFDGQRLRTPGVNWGYGDSDLWLVGKTSHYLVVRKPGGTDWEGRGQSGYFPAVYLLLEYRPSNDRFETIAEIEEVEPGRKWRAARTRLLERMNELEAKWKP